MSLDKIKRVVYSRVSSYQVHKEVEDDGDVADEEDGRPARDGVGWHHHIGVAKKRKKVNSPWST